MKRGETGLCFVVGIDKPEGLTSHDVVNRCRRIFGEKRVGHTGTLDPLASGAMAVCVGPATKLSNYLTFHDKEYLARIVFGSATDTDDSCGQVVRTAPVPPRLEDPIAAQEVLEGMVGTHDQLPPAYSAKKVNGVRAYEAARKGRVIDLQPREVTIYSARIADVGRDESGELYWDVRFAVSAGTYIRSIARDLGIAQGTCAHLSALRRLRSGNLRVDECVTLEALEEHPESGRLDPLRLLGLRYAALDDPVQEKSVSNGGKLTIRNLVLHELQDIPANGSASSPCTAAAFPSHRPLTDGELVAVLSGNKLAAVYAYESSAHCLKSRCGFALGVSRGTI